MGGVVKNGGIRIPFSNGYEWEATELGNKELTWMLLPKDERDVFGITIKEIRGPRRNDDLHFHPDKLR